MPLLPPQPPPTTTHRGNPLPPHLSLFSSVVLITDRVYQLGHRPIPPHGPTPRLSAPQEQNLCCALGALERQHLEQRLVHGKTQPLTESVQVLVLGLKAKRMKRNHCNLKDLSIYSNRGQPTFSIEAKKGNIFGTAGQSLCCKSSTLHRLAQKQSHAIHEMIVAVQ